MGHHCGGMEILRSPGEPLSGSPSPTPRPYDPKYAASAQETIAVGTYFELQDVETSEWRIGYYDVRTRRLTILTELGFVHFVDRRREAGYRELTPHLPERVSHGSPASGDCTGPPGL